MELLTQSKGTLFSFLCTCTQRVSHYPPFLHQTCSLSVKERVRCNPCQVQILWKWWTFCAQPGQIIPTVKPHWVQISPSCQNVYHPQLAQVTSTSVKCRLLHKTKSTARADSNHHAPSADLHAGSMFACCTTPTTPTPQLNPPSQGVNPVLRHNFHDLFCFYKTNFSP